MVNLRWLARAAAASGVLFWPVSVFADDIDTKEPSTIVWASGDHAHGSYEDADVGFITALSGDLSQNGFVLRGDSLHVNVIDDGFGWDWDALIGYQYHFTAVTVSAFAGADFQRQPDSRGDNEQGYKTGFKVAASVETGREAQFVGIWDGVYSTNANTYWTRGRAGYNWRKLLIGPESVFQGDDSYRSERVGAFVAIPADSLVGHSATVEFAGGYQSVTNLSNGNTGSQNAPGGPTHESGPCFSVGLDFSF